MRYTAVPLLLRVVLAAQLASTVMTSSTGLCAIAVVTRPERVESQPCDAPGIVRHLSDCRESLRKTPRQTPPIVWNGSAYSAPS